MMLRFRWSRCLALALTLASLAGFGSLAAAEPATFAPGSAPENQAAARAEFREASRLAQAGAWALALHRYRTSLALYPHATTLYNVGYCHEKLGDFAAALRDTRAALAFEAVFPLRGLSNELRSKAMAALTELEPKVGKLTLSSTANDVAIQLDDRALQVLIIEGHRVGFSADEPAGSGWTPVAGPLSVVLNVGSHVLEWQNGPRRGTHRFEIHAEETEEFALPDPGGLPADVAPSARQSPPALLSPSLPSSVSSASSGDRARQPQSLRTWGFVTLAVGAGSALAGAGAGWVALRTKQDLDARCNSEGACPSTQSERMDRFDAAATVSTVAFTGALALSTIGITLLILNPAPTAHPRAALRISSSQLELHAEF